MTPKRVDDNQKQIVRALRQIGCSVQIISAVGKGCPDLLVGYSGQNLVMEVKDCSKPPSKRRLTPDEAKWHKAWRGDVVIVESVEAALAVVLC